MQNIVIYTKDHCPYCVKAKKLLERKGLTFREIAVVSEETKNEVVKKSGGRMTVPQIFINDKHVGGCDDLYALNDSGELDKILNLN